MIILQKRGAMEYTIMVVEKLDFPTTLQYLASYVGMTLSEYYIGRAHIW